MGDFKINEKTVFSQSGSDEPAMGSTVTGIPAAGVTGVLPSAVTGGSGLTALGTVTVGNLSNTAIVYPDGHILKIVDGGFGASASEATSSDVFQNTDVDATITYTAGNKIFAIAHANFYSSGGGIDSGAEVQLSTNANNDNNDMIGNNAIFYNYVSPAAPEARLTVPLIALFSPSGTSVTVTMKFRAANSGAVTVYNAINRIILMEIQA